MFKLNLKIALRNLWKNRGITSINVGGLAVALAAFILVMMYATYETNFDRQSPYYDRIYQVGRIYPEFKTNYTSPPLAKAIKMHFPEVERAGIAKASGFEYALSKDNRVFFAKNSLVMEYDVAQMFGLKPSTGLIKPTGTDRLFYLNEQGMQTLFPNKTDLAPEMVTMGSKSAGQTGVVSGSVKSSPQSNLKFDALAITAELDADKNYGFNNYYTYIQVKPGTDVANLENKITELYRSEMRKGETDVATLQKINTLSTFLDPLKNLHLRPKAGNDANYKVLITISSLGFLILIIAGINFTNLSIAQATKRAKEVGVKKVMGAFRFQLTIQFLLELFLQCLVALIFALVIAEIALPQFNALFLVDLSIWETSNGLIWQLPLILIFLTLIAGLYPSLVLSGFNPATVLKGNFSLSRQNYWLRNGLLVVQFSVAVIFIIGLLVINNQLKYMKTQDVGFSPDQVVQIKNIAYFNNSDDFSPIRERLLKIEGVKSVTVAGKNPVGSENGVNTYSVDGQETNIDFLDVDFDYFETLGIKVKEGRTFNKSFIADTASSAVLNESAVAKYGLKNPIGKTIRGCGIAYRIVGVVKDFKAQGFENQVQPTIYTMKNPCGNSKTAIMLKIDEKYMSAAIASIKNQWPNINKKDGDFVRYEFLDELYGKLFEKQEQLQSIFFAAAMLTIFIAILGLFAYAKYITNGKIKEIAVRKILGATDLQIFKLLNKSFVLLVIVANVIAWPLAYILTKSWLATFAYRIDIPIAPFVGSAFITILLTLLTVSFQARKAIKANPVNALKYE